MPEARSLAIQSVLFGNTPHEVIRAAEASSNTVQVARDAGLISTWELRLGDCSPEPVFDAADLARIRALLAKTAGKLECKTFGKNLGSAAGHNALAQGGGTDLLLILNPDARMGPDTVSVLTRALTADVGIVEARQVPFEHPKDFTKGTGDTGWASMACALTPRSVFEQIDGFDAESFFLYCDDVDYSWRVRLAGFRVVFEPAASVFHDKRLTPDGDWMPSSAEVYYSAEAALLLAHKYSRPEIVRSLREQYRREGTELLQKALGDYETREREGRLPQPIDPRRTVAEFRKVHYAPHRF